MVSEEPAPPSPGANPPRAPRGRIGIILRGPAGFPELRRFSHRAMATTFEILTAFPDARYAGEAAQAAFEELDRLEGELSRFIENSDVSRINHRVTDEPLRVGRATFECLSISKRLHAETKGAFDITVGGLVDEWLGRGGAMKSPSEDVLRRTRERTGLHRIRLDPRRRTVRLTRPPVAIDLGGLGKGYALDEMASILREWDIDVALLHGGWSSVLAHGCPPGTEGWPLAFSDLGGEGGPLAHVRLKGGALGASSLRKGPHIIDPRTGRPARGRHAAWAGAPTAAVADALSTAFMIMSQGEIDAYCLRHPDTVAVILPEDGRPVVRRGRASAVHLDLLR